MNEIRKVITETESMMEFRQFYHQLYQLIIRNKNFNDLGKSSSRHSSSKWQGST